MMQICQSIVYSLKQRQQQFDEVLVQKSKEEDGVRDFWRCRRQAAFDINILHWNSKKTEGDSSNRALFVG